MNTATLAASSAYGESRTAAGGGSSRSAAAAARWHNPFVPLLLGLLALLGMLALQGALLLAEHDALSAAHAAQQRTVDSAAGLRASLDALAADTQRLADAGNPNAGLLVAELRRRGVTIDPNGGGSAPASASPASR